MAIRTIRTEKEEVLRKVSKPVKQFDESLWTLLDDMKETTNTYQISVPHMKVAQI